MADQNKESKQLAPAKIGRLLRRRYTKAGRRDAKKFDSVHHSAATPMITQLHGEARTKQLAVNSWYAQQVRPFQLGIAECRAAIAKLEEDLKQNLSERPESAREQNRLAEKAELLEKQIEAQKVQIEYNLANGKTIRMRAQQYLRSWANYQEQLASFYARGRAEKTKLVQPGVSFTTPVFTGVDLIKISEFED